MGQAAPNGFPVHYVVNIALGSLGDATGLNARGVRRFKDEVDKSATLYPEEHRKWAFVFVAQKRVEDLLRRTKPQIEMRRTPGMGWGVFTTRLIRKGTVVTLYPVDIVAYEKRAPGIEPVRQLIPAQRPDLGDCNPALRWPKKIQEEELQNEDRLIKVLGEYGLATSPPALVYMGPEADPYEDFKKVLDEEARGYPPAAISVPEFVNENIEHVVRIGHLVNGTVSAELARNSSGKLLATPEENIQPLRAWALLDPYCNSTLEFMSMPLLGHSPDFINLVHTVNRTFVRGLVSSELRDILPKVPISLFVTSRDIPADEQLFFDYGPTYKWLNFS